MNAGLFCAQILETGKLISHCFIITLMRARDYLVGAALLLCVTGLAAKPLSFLCENEGNSMLILL